ncbi:MAG: FixH family protein [Anaeromyxobacter sp.]|nr:FixH family protein [Anaeromyxobacter sp.]MBL0277857.1 FixH family protein [Anaeromyxobacter sp.]
MTTPRKARPRTGHLAALAGLLLAGAAAAQQAPAADVPLVPAAGLVSGLPPAAAAPGTAAQQSGATRLVRDGLAVEFTFTATEGGGAPREGDQAELRFRITDAGSGEPVRGLSPAVWMDVAGGLSGGAGGHAECKEKVALYLKGLVGIRPVLDLNSYYLLVLNQDPSIAVIDPVVSMTGKTSLFATVLLPRPGADWVKARGDKRLFVSIPLVGQVAVVDTETFHLITTVPAGEAPTRLALAPSGRTLWVGNDARGKGQGGVTVIDVETLRPLASIPTGPGHHEIAFSGDDRYAFVTNRGAGTVSVVEVASLKKVKDLPVGPTPISIGWSSLSQRIYVADGKEGRITVIDPATLAVAARIQAKPGLGPMRFSEDGRWAFLVNSVEHVVHVVDAAQDRLAHAVKVPGKPYQLAITRAFAYVRLMDSEKVQMINLLSLGKQEPPIVNSFPAGERAPQAAGELSLADAISPAATDAAVYVNNPAEGLTYFYMEGMNAPMGNFSSYGHRTRAVTVVDRSVKELEPGVYGGTVRVPAAASYDVAFLLDSPRVLHCFPAEAAENPALATAAKAVKVEFLGTPVSIPLGTPIDLRLRLSDGKGRPRAGVRDVQVTSYRPPGYGRSQVTAVDAGDGVYQARLTLPAAGAWYLQVTVPSLDARPDEIPFRSLVVTAPAAGAPAR